MGSGNLPNDEPWHYIFELSHYAGVKAILDLQTHKDVQLCDPNNCYEISSENKSQFQILAYPYPEEKCNLKRILE